MNAIAPLTGHYSNGCIAYVWMCHQCHESHEYAAPFEAGQVLLNPSLPDGWRVIDDRLYCPKHQILVIVDGEAKVGEARYASVTRRPLLGSVLP